jgi:hypothetical protein
MHVVRKIRSAALIAGAGAAAAYLFDPENGPARRERLRGSLEQARQRMTELSEARGASTTPPPVDGADGSTGAPTPAAVADAVSEAASADPASPEAAQPVSASRARPDAPAPTVPGPAEALT